MIPTIALDEAIAVEAFNSFKQQLLPMLGNGVTNSQQLNEIGHQVLPGRFAGVFTQDTDIDTSKPYSIYNLDVKGQPGSHWVATAVHTSGRGATGKPQVLVYDSFGRKSDKILPILSKKYDIIDTDYDAEQVESEDNCGLNSMAWLMVCDTLGPYWANLI